MASRARGAATTSKGESEWGSTRQAGARIWLLLSVVALALVAIAARLWRRRRRGGRAGGDGARRAGACRDGSRRRHGGRRPRRGPRRDDRGGRRADQDRHLSNVRGTVRGCLRGHAGRRVRAVHRARGDGQRAQAERRDHLGGRRRAPDRVRVRLLRRDAGQRALEARRLVEQEGVDILHAPLSGSEGIAIAELRQEHPEVTFVNGTSARRTRRSRCSARTSTASTPTARSGRQASGPTRTTCSAGGASPRSETTTTSRTRRWRASWPSSARSAARCVGSPLARPGRGGLLLRSSPRSPTTSTASSSPSAARARSPS